MPKSGNEQDSCLISHRSYLLNYSNRKLDSQRAIHWKMVLEEHQKMPERLRKAAEAKAAIDE